MSKYEAFLKTVELGNITQAADVLGYTQPAVSRVIADLEREWGVPLLIRNRTGVSLTPEGEYLIPQIRAVCAAQRELEGSVERLLSLDSCHKVRKGRPKALDRGRRNTVYLRQSL